MIENNIKYCRNELEMTQTELGYVFGVRKSTVSNWENGYEIIPLNKLIKFCNLYGYSFDFVLGLSKKKKSDIKVNTDKKDIGKRLRRLRKSLHLTQEMIADECSISRATYCHYEIGMNLVSTFTLYTICKKHNISFDSFLKEEVFAIN